MVVVAGVGAVGKYRLTRVKEAAAASSIREVVTTVSICSSKSLSSASMDSLAKIIAMEASASVNNVMAERWHSTARGSDMSSCKIQGTSRFSFAVKSAPMRSANKVRNISPTSSAR
eukprot:scaffold10212_cov127-Amphora_coffeaeformis.AAC.4